MSLTRLLKDKEVKAKFKDYLNKPRVKYSNEIKVPYKSNHYPQIGVAFDYLMQLYLKKIASRN
jgi:queuine/archaeosine tRNA-ribosyltransferase